MLPVAGWHAPGAKGHMPVLHINCLHNDNLTGQRTCHLRSMATA